MEAESIESLTPLLQGADQWSELLLLLPLLVALEAVLSADNAIALAAISRRLQDPIRQRQALNLGLLLALVFRMGLIVAARWVLDFWPLQLAASAYLLWLAGSHLLGRGQGIRPAAGARRGSPLPIRWGCGASCSPSPSPIWPSRSTASPPPWPSPTASGW
ncbi:TerC family protein [Cyanobium sp. ULC082]